MNTNESQQNYLDPTTNPLPKPAHPSGETGKAQAGEGGLENGRGMEVLASKMRSGEKKKATASHTSQHLIACYYPLSTFLLVSHHIFIIIIVIIPHTRRFHYSPEGGI